ncbi:hypothetical protein N9U27_02210 [Candidatus Pelagibacter sp.]|nr:hypothetical protein [Candidatus Pelagibacter sp.]
MNKNFEISNQEYLFYIKYFNLIQNNKILDIANIKLNNYSRNNSSKFLDFYLNFCIKYYFDIFYLDFLTKFLFKKSIIRFKLNLILALHEADYDNFQLMISSSNYTRIILDILKFTIILFTFPIWIIYKFLIFFLTTRNLNA